MIERIIIIGNGVAGITAALTARSRSAGAEIIVISPESDYFFSRTALMYAYMNRLDRRDLEPYERSMYDQQKIARRRDTIVELDSNRGLLRTRQGDDLFFDRLLIASGSVPNQLEAPGLVNVKSGVVNFVSLQDLDACEAHTPTTQEAIVVGGGLIGIELVECLRHHGVKVTFLVRDSSYWPVALGPEEAEMVTAHMGKHGVDVRLTEEIGAVSADEHGRIREVQTKRGEQLPCQLLGICVGVRPAIDWLAGCTTKPEFGRGILVDDKLRTSLPNVWAAGDCAEIKFAHADRPMVEQIWYSAKRQGALAGENLTGGQRRYQPPIFFNSSKLFDIEYTTVGQVNRVPPGARSLYRRSREQNISQRIIHLDGQVIGFNMLGSRWDHSILSRWIEEARDLTWVLGHLQKAQFDAEFGRVKLADMKESTLLPEASRSQG